MTDYQLMNLKANAVIVLVAVIGLIIAYFAVNAINRKIDKWNENRPKVKERR